MFYATRMRTCFSACCRLCCKPCAATSDSLVGCLHACLASQTCTCFSANVARTGHLACTAASDSELIQSPSTIYRARVPCTEPEYHVQSPSTIYRARVPYTEPEYHIQSPSTIYRARVPCTEPEYLTAHVNHTHECCTCVNHTHLEERNTALIR
jgi:hypothetical protein